MQSPYIELKCDYCGEKIKVPLGPNAQPPQEIASWLKVTNAKGETFDYCRVGCALNGLRTQSNIILTDVEQRGDNNAGLSSGVVES